MLLNVEKIELIKNLCNEKLLKNKKYIEIQEILKIMGAWRRCR
ncbi:hypothetical protein SIXOD_v1c13970 [Spiroplasma ixodetis Y32]|nr:hypothetical protein SIXOD_v1c13970 [Spiroplasma ixodetis Y32]